MGLETEVKRSQIISFLSGKGGAGKTSTAISVAHLLKDVGFRILLTDFDFATNGATYFYKHLFLRHSGLQGLSEVVDSMSGIESHSDLPGIEVKEGLFFLPSRVNFSKKTPLRNPLSDNEDAARSFLSSILNLFKSHFDFIIIDN